MTSVLERLKARFEGHRLYVAGLPHFDRNFTRDSILSVLLMKDMPMLREQLLFCAKHQGRVRDPYTGEEPGKIHHEYPGYELRGLSTQYNACDTTALFLIGHQVYYDKTEDVTFLEKNIWHIRQATEYIKRHLKEYLFYEDPAEADARTFAAKVTYWKDSEIYGRVDGRPSYPSVFVLSHAQNLKALRSAAFLLDDAGLDRIADRMVERLKTTLFDVETNSFLIATDQDGPIRGISSDALHILYYLETDDLDDSFTDRICESSATLESPLGYRTLEMNKAGSVKDRYHAGSIWPFEQALIHAAAKKHGLEHAMSVAKRIVPYLDSHPELFYFDGFTIAKAGCDPQLWTVAAGIYFERESL